MTGVCQKCGCTDETPCESGCAWVNPERTLCSRCAGEEPPMFPENFTSAAIDGARVSVVTASVLVGMDSRLGEFQRERILAALEAALEILQKAREELPVRATSLHRIIVP